MVVKMAPVLISSPVTDTESDQKALRQVWQTLGPDSCPRSYNFHCHTTASDGQLYPKTLIEQAIAIGLKGFAITDHHTIDGYQIAKTCLHSLQNTLPHQAIPHLWIGVEINARLLNTDVHILGYAFDPHNSQLQPYLQGKAPKNQQAEAATVIDVLHQAGGLAVLAHPCRYRRRSAKELIPAAASLGIDGVETYYAYANPNPWHPSPRQTQQVKQLSAPYNLFNTCGTDTHGSNLLRRL
ncbi:PHP domain-containing protein [Coleofasciculus sp. D1-CHI-01]|uniref:PHP domain-containing protein n=1 Tax=Coleofasciculus sp. D1-CHI-01 TaxID=3068482 RepID=UPI0040637E09